MVSRRPGEHFASWHPSVGVCVCTPLVDLTALAAHLPVGTTNAARSGLEKRYLSLAAASNECPGFATFGQWYERFCAP